MNDLYGRTVFFVKDAERSLRFYLDIMGFSLDWNHQEAGKPFVFQVSLFGFQLILNQIEPKTQGRAGHGRVFFGLNGDQAGEFLNYIREKGLTTRRLHWGAQTLVIQDLDKNEFYIWLPEKASLSADTPL